MSVSTLMDQDPIQGGGGEEVVGVEILLVFSCNLNNSLICRHSLGSSRNLSPPQTSAEAN